MAVTKLTSVDFDKIIMLGIEEVYAFDRSTGELKFAFDQIKSGELTGNNDVTYAEGKRGVRLATLKSNKTSGFNCENGYVVYSALATQMGGKIEEASSTNKIKVVRAELLTAETLSTTDNNIGVTLSVTPVAGSLKVYETNSDKTKKALATATEVGTKVTIADAVKGDVYLCVYEEEVEVGKRVVNDGESFADDVKLVINMLGQDICTSQQYLIQCIMPKASISGEWNMSLGNDPAVHSFSAEAMLDVCSTDNELCEFILC